MYIIQEVTLTSLTTVRVFFPNRETDGEVLRSRASPLRRVARGTMEARTSSCSELQPDV